MAFEFVELWNTVFLLGKYKHFIKQIRRFPPHVSLFLLPLFVVSTRRKILNGG